jgi:hypothetical protein
VILTGCVCCDAVERGLIPWIGETHDRAAWATASPARRQRMARAHGLVLAVGGRAWGDDTGPWIPAPKDAPDNPAEDWETITDGLHARIEAEHRKNRRARSTT